MRAKTCGSAAARYQETRQLRVSINDRLYRLRLRLPAYRFFRQADSGRRMSRGRRSTAFLSELTLFLGDDHALE